MGYRSFFIKNVDKVTLTKKLKEKLSTDEIIEFSLIDKNSKSRDMQLKYFETGEGNPDFFMINERLVENWIEIHYCNRSNLENWSYLLSKEFQTELVVVNVLWDAGYFYLSNYRNGEKIKKIKLFGLPDGPMAEYHDGDYSYIGVKVNFGEKIFSYEDDLDSLLMKYGGYGHNVIEDYCDNFGIKRREFFSDFPDLDEYYVITTKRAQNRVEEKDKKYANIEKRMRFEDYNSDDLPFEEYNSDDLPF